MDIQLKESGEIDVSPRWKKKNDEMRAYYINYREAEDDLGQKVNELALITHEENPSWSLNKIATFIYLANEDLDGLSKNQIYKKVTDENRIILDVKTPKRVKALPNQLLEELRQQKGRQVSPEEEETELQNNVPEERFLYTIKTKETFVPEQSSSTNDVEVEEEEEEEKKQQIIYDDPQKLIKSYEEQIIKINKEYERLQQKNEELDTKYNEIIEPYQVKESIIVNDQEIPLIMTADPFRRTITVELDQKEVKKLKRM